MNISSEKDYSHNLFKKKQYLESRVKSIIRGIKYSITLNKSDSELINKKSQEILKKLEQNPKIKLSKNDISVIKSEVKESYYKLLVEKKGTEDLSLMLENIPSEVRSVIKEHFSYQKYSKINDFNFYAQTNLKSIPKKDVNYNLARLHIESDPILKNDFSLLNDSVLIESAKQRSREIDNCKNYHDILKVFENIVEDVNNRVSVLKNKDKDSLGADDRNSAILAYLLVINNSKLDDAINKLSPYMKTAGTSQNGRNLEKEYGGVILQIQLGLGRIRSNLQKSKLDKERV